MGNGVPIHRRGRPGTSEYIGHREERDDHREEGEEKMEKEKRISKIQQEPDTNTDYSGG